MEVLSKASIDGDPNFIEKYGELIAEGAKLDHISRSVGRQS
jgi:hypothetical protein